MTPDRLRQLRNEIARLQQELAELRRKQRR
jgi:hypothetical protein